MDNVYRALSSFIGGASVKIRQPKLSDEGSGDLPSPAAFRILRDSLSVSSVLHIRLEDVPHGEDLNPDNEEWWYG